MFKSDIEIAQEAKMSHIRDIAGRFGIAEDELEFYGKYKAKLTDELEKRVAGNKDGKLILVTAINPTPAGEGKTTISIGLTEALNKLGKKTMAALREPSLGPCFGIKGGAAGGGYSQVVPMEDLNLHFTGDFHAITSANNLLAALLDNHIQQGNELQIDTRQVVWKRCLDMNDRVLRNIVVGLGAKADGVVREDHFVITVASEIMAILCLATDMADLKNMYDIDSQKNTVLFEHVCGMLKQFLNCEGMKRKELSVDWEINWSSKAKDTNISKKENLLILSSFYDLLMLYAHDVITENLDGPLWYQNVVKNSFEKKKMCCDILRIALEEKDACNRYNDLNLVLYQSLYQLGGINDTNK